jgi:NAD(P)-dependent dehydrogenase (short-subunit alcohol dehydrogenase family)
MHDLAGKVALVTGSSHGIGLGIAGELDARGVRVVGVDVADGPAGAPTVRADIGRDDPAAIAQQVAAPHGVPELIVNNVGVDLPGGFLDADPAVVDDTWRINLHGPWMLTKQLVTSLLDEGRTGNVVFVCSQHGATPRTHPHYSASKAALRMLMREMAHELGPKGIRVNAVSPGVIASSSVTEHNDERIRRLVPLGRIGQPADVARMVAVLLSDELAAYVTGTNVDVDGGLSTFTWSDQP